MGVVASENLSVGAVTLPAMDTYKIPLPQMLSEGGGGACQQYDLLLHQLAIGNSTWVTWGHFEQTGMDSDWHRSQGFSDL